MKTAIEIGEMILNGETRSMVKHEAENFLMLELLRKCDKALQQSAFPMKSAMQVPSFAIIKKRCGWANVQADDMAIMSLAMLSDRPGTAVLYVAVLAAVEKRAGKPVDFDNLYEDDNLGKGIPSDQNLKAAWEAQKDGGGNWLDRPAAWISATVAA